LGEGIEEKRKNGYGEGKRRERKEHRKKKAQRRIKTNCHHQVHFFIILELQYTLMA